MSYNFDQRTDYSGKETFAYLKDIEQLPEYVKTAEVDDLDAIDSLPKTAFADNHMRIYPLNSPARVYVSNAFFLNKKAAIEKLYGKSYVAKLETNIKTAAEVFEITKDLEDYSSHFNQKTASDYSERFMGEFELEGMEVNLYNVKTANDLTEAADDYVKNIKNYPFDWRTKIAENMVSTAKELNVDQLPELVFKYAGMFYPDLAGLDTEIWRRSTKLKKEANKKIYDSLIEDTSNMTSLSEVMKIAEVLFHVENMEGLYDNPKTASVLGDPVDRIFTASIEKVASDLNYIEMGGEKYKIDDLSKVASSKYEEAFGIPLDPSDIDKLAEILPTMPRTDVKFFEEITGLAPL